MRPTVVRTERGPVEVCDVGSGPVLLVVHGTPGDWRQAVTVAEDLSTHARVLLVSRPGYGRTPLSSGPTTADMADLWACLLTALDVPRAVVLGISGGGPCAHAFAARHPSRCSGLLLCCALQPALFTVPASMRSLAAIPGLWSAVAALGRVRAHLVPPPSVVAATFTDRERQLLDDPWVRAAAETFGRNRPSWTRGRGLRNDTRQIHASTALPEWPSGATLPVAVLHGDADEVVPLSHGLDYANKIPGARLEVVQHLGHALPLFARAQLNLLLDGLLGLPVDVPQHPPHAQTGTSTSARSSPVTKERP